LDTSPSVFNPTSMDSDQRAAAARSAGMKYGVLTTKHHDGFAL
jgi:alpha-L-fucosidase